MGSDLYLAWPSAEIAVMGAKGAVEILHRRETPERRAQLEAEYEERFLNPYVAAERGFVDAVIDPADTRREVAAALELLATKRERLGDREARQHAAVSRRRRGTLRVRSRTPWPTASRSPTTAPASRSRSRSSTAASTPPSGASSCPGIWFYDPALMTTAVDVERHHRPRRRGRHPALPRLPDRAAGRALDLPRGRLPPHPRRAAHRRSSSSRGCTTSRTTRSSTRTCASGSWRASTTTPTRWGCSCRPSPRCRPSTPRPRTSTTRTSRYKQIVRLIAKMPTLAAGCPPLQRRACRSSTPTTRLDFTANFLSMMWKVAEPRYDANPALARALDVLFILHADHEQNCATTAMRTVGSRPRRPVLCHRRRRRRPLRPAPRRRQRGRHPHAHRDRLDRQRRRRSSTTVKARQGPAARASATASTRTTTRGPTIIKQTADEVFEVTGKNPLLDIALKLEEVALADDYFISPQALPERRLLLGPHLPGDGLPDRDVHGAVRHPPHRRAGWPTGWSCSSRTRRSPGPASSTSAPDVRDYVADRPARADRRARGHDRRRRASSGASTPTPSPAHGEVLVAVRAAGPQRRRPPAGRRPLPAAARARRPTSPGWSWPARSSRSGPGADALRGRRPGDGRGRRRRPGRAGRGPRAPPPARARRRAVGRGRRVPRGRSPPPTTPCSPSAACSWASGCVHGAAGGVGHRPAVQLAAAAGAQVVATVRDPRAPRGGGGAAPAPPRVDPEGFDDARALRRRPRAGRRAEPARRPRGARHRRPHRGDRRRRRRQGRGQPARADGQAGPHPRLHAPRPLRSRRRPTRARPWSATCSAARRRARSGCRCTPPSRWPTPPPPTSGSPPAASSARSSSLA